MKNKRKILLVSIISVLIGVFLISTIFISPGKASDQIKVYVDGKQVKFSVPPELVGGRTLVPLREIFEAMGAEVKWDYKEQLVTASRGKELVILQIGQKTASINGQKVTLDAVPIIVEGRTLVPLRFIGEALGADVNWNKKNLSVYINMDNIAQGNLPVVGSKEKLKELLSQGQVSGGRLSGHGIFRTGTDMAKAEESMNTAASPETMYNSDFSSTNIQVQGVDEGDLVKTDGKYIYQVNNQRVVIAKVLPIQDMKILNVIDLTKEPFHPTEMYLDEKFLVVIGISESYYPMPRAAAEKLMAPDMMPPIHGYRPMVKAMVYDISSKENIELVREVELDGHYVSSRKIGSALYLVANKHINYYILEQGEDLEKPMYRDTARSPEFVEIDYEAIRYFPGSIEPNYLLVAGVDLAQPNKHAEVSTFLGSGQNIYASLQNLYVAVTQYDFDEKAYIDNRSTLVYSFNLDKGSISYNGKGRVPGSLLNQFSMDEHNGYFRVATTTGDIWRTDEHTSKNNVYILDKALNIVGKVEDIAPGETIYSVRFMGDRGYMVTFKTVDPLFVIDLKNPERPAVLGALKIPGYSDYLHPYDENHLIGFGKDAVEVDNMAYYLGMKMAIFDVTDVNNPKEKFVEMIGDRGTESELLRNHKALLFSREKKLLAFPVTIMEVKHGRDYNYKGIPPYGEFVFQGAYIYHIDTETGFKLKGKISHLSNEDYLKAGNYWYDSNKNIERILYIGDTLYTLSKKIWQAHGLNKLEYRSSLEIPEASPIRDTVYPIGEPGQSDPGVKTEQ